MISRSLHQFGRFLGRKIQSQQTIDTSLSRSNHILLDSLRENQVVIGIENYRHFGMLSNFLNQSKDITLIGSRFKCSLRCQLIGQAIGKRIGKRNSELKQVDSVGDQGSTNIKGRVEVWIACTHIADKGSSPFIFAIREKFRDSVRIIHK